MKDAMEELAVAAGRAVAVQAHLLENAGKLHERLRVRAWFLRDRRKVRRAPGGGVEVPPDWPAEPVTEVRRGEADIDIRGAGTFRIATGHRDALAAEAGLAAADLYGCGLEVIATETVNRPEAVGWNVEALPFWDGAGVSLYGRALPTEAGEDWARQGLVSVEWRLYRL